MAHFYSNENFPLPVVDELRKQGHSVLTIQETGKANQAMADEEVLSFAFQHDRVLLTLNRKHFIRLHKKKAKHAGIFACTFDPNFKALAKRIHESVKKESDLTGQLIRINRPQK
ncbi:MAG: DUF5615 family PIN-like protein [Deltaproteobacteria bacterium]|nr:DUF5615 family PIN-like protein [Deltaproteobacteria bacterium]